MFYLYWPGGSFRASARSTPGKTVAELERRLAELAPDLREQTTVKAIVSAHDTRWACLASWSPCDTESLATFVARARREVTRLPPIAFSTRVDAWIDESDL